MRARYARLGLLFFLIAAIGCVPLNRRKAPPSTIDPDMVDLLEWMTGHFSSREQAESDSTYHDIRLHMVPIWTERKDGHWFYVEQRMAGQAPYRQRIYRVSRIATNLYESAVYLIPNEAQFIDAWKDTDRFSVLAPTDLTTREGCAVQLRRVDRYSYAGATSGEGCPSTLHGAAYATSEVSISPTVLMSWDRGFDALGRQVWGATKGSYIFRKVSAREAERD